ncbi:MAG: hypothetical protein IJA77_07190 [Clostridia bacterium]|nr:hypothetical protein [Clostridia bacterium]
MIFHFDHFHKSCFRFIKGCRADCERKLHEGFEETTRGFIANVSAENIDPLIRDYIAAQTEELFLFIEKPCNLAEEEPDEHGVVTQPHVNVYYWDGISKAEANAVLDQYGDWLINDGFVCFGFGVKGCASEIMKDKYNVISVYSVEKAKERPLLAQRFPQVQELRTAWDYFTHQHPGDCFQYRRDGKNAHDIVKELLQQGLYFAERREAR